MSDDLSGLPGEEIGPDQGRARVRKAPTAFRTISEVADDLHVPQHVLRFWETKFPQVKPLKRGGGRRYYRPDDLALLKRISELLYTQGYTIKGVQRLLREGRADEAGPASWASSDVEDDAEMDASRAGDDKQPLVAVESAAEAGVLPQPDEGEARRLRETLRETLAALEALRAALG